MGKLAETALHYAARYKSARKFTGKFGEKVQSLAEKSAGFEYRLQAMEKQIGKKLDTD